MWETARNPYSSSWLRWWALELRLGNGWNGLIIAELLWQTVVCCWGGCCGWLAKVYTFERATSVWWPSLLAILDVQQWLVDDVLFRISWLFRSLRRGLMTFSQGLTTLLLRHEPTVGPGRAGLAGRGGGHETVEFFSFELSAKFEPAKS